MTGCLTDSFFFFYFFFSQLLFPYSSSVASSLFSSFPSLFAREERSKYTRVSRSVVKACSPSPSLLTTFSTSVLACRLSYSRRANQSAFRSNGPHDNYGCCHTHTRACTFSLYSCVCVFSSKTSFGTSVLERRRKGKKEKLFSFFGLIVLCFMRTQSL